MFQEFFFYVFLLITGFFAGIFAGLLGLGGAIILIPVLLYLPCYLGLPIMDMHTVTGVAALQTFFSTASSSYFHSKTRNVNYTIVLKVGVGLAFFAVISSLFSKYFSSIFLLTLYAVMIGLGAILLLFRSENGHHKPVGNIEIPTKKAFLLGALVGIPSGALGLAGGAVLLPIVNSIFQVPLNVSISTCTHLSLIAASMSLIGKFFTGQVVLTISLIVSVSAFIGAYVGSVLNKRIKPEILKWILLCVLFIVFFKVVSDLLGMI